jgi:hypothetical protein
MRRAWHAFAGYLAVSVFATWPLAAGLTRHVPWDLGDPQLVMWILAWDCEQLLAILTGDLSRIATFFNAPIFHPAPLTLAYSEHFLAQAIQVLPVYAVTRDPILSYNLLFLSTFVLSGLGTYLFVRELTGDGRAAFVAGLLFAFAPYRMPQGPHLQVLSSQWMPFALYGFRRFFDAVGGPAAVAPSALWPASPKPWRRREGPRRRWLRPLAGAGAALVAQNLSCIYYMLYFTPFAAAYVIWEAVQRGLWRSRRVILAVGATAAAVILISLPVLLPYVAVRETLELTRSQGETIRYSADVYSYATAASGQVLWGSAARAFPKPEGDLFPGLVVLALALIGATAFRGSVWRREPAPRVRSGQATAGETRPVLAWTLRVAMLLHIAAAVSALLYRRLSLDLGVFTLRIGNITQMLLRAAVLAGIIAVISPPARQRMQAFLRTRGFFVLALLAAVWLSLGPAPRSLGVPIDLASPYSALQEYVPGFDGLRVPARLGMIAALMLAVLGGMGALRLASLVQGFAPTRHWATPVLAVVSALALAESVILPLPVVRIAPPSRAPAVYAAAARTPAGAVIAELPLGRNDGDLQAMFYGLRHRRPVLNGYSGFFPPHYGLLAVAVSDVPRHTDVALDALRQQGATHVIVHESAWPDGQGVLTTAALRERGAIEEFRSGPDVLLRLRER